MKYRKFGNIDWEVSALGFGTMRLPTVDGNVTSEQIDEDKAIAMIRFAIDKGVNYIDTAWPYHNGRSEIVIGKALQDGYRKRVKIATKSPIHLLKGEDDFDYFLDEQLKRLNMDYIDFYLLHGVTLARWEKVLKLNVLKKAEAALDDGRIKHLGFSFHDNLEVFKQIVDEYDKWDFCQIQYNYMDIEKQASRAGLKYAAEKGLAVIVMEPLLGGRLANPPKDILELMQSANSAWTPTEWALQWLWNQQEVSVVLSGMSTMQQVQQNVRYAAKSSLKLFNNKKISVLDKVREQFLRRTLVPCTHCGYCLPCPSGVHIPGNFNFYNDGYIFNDVNDARKFYKEYLEPKLQASNCVQCKVCEEKCPQGIVISELMPIVHEVLGEDKAYRSVD